MASRRVSVPPSSVGAGKELHDDARQAVQLVDVIGLHEICVMQPRRDPRLAQEALAERRFAGEVLGQDLERDGPVEPLVMRGVDDGHPAAADLAVDAIAAHLS